MTKNPAKHGYSSFKDEVKMRTKRLKPSLPQLSSKSDKKYTQKELEEIHATRRLRYNDLLNCARNDDMSAAIVLPTADKFEIPMSRVSRSFREQVELLDIYHYLENERRTFHLALLFAHLGLH